jgi:hypothetical protein
MGHEKEGEPGIGSMSFSAFGEEEDGRRLPKRRVEGDESGCTWQVTM